MKVERYAVSLVYRKQLNNHHDQRVETEIVVSDNPAEALGMAIGITWKPDWSLVAYSSREIKEKK